MLKEQQRDEQHLKNKLSVNYTPKTNFIGIINNQATLLVEAS